MINELDANGSQWFIIWDNWNRLWSIEEWNGYNSTNGDTLVCQDPFQSWMTPYWFYNGMKLSNFKIGGLPTHGICDAH